MSSALSPVVPVDTHHEPYVVMHAGDHVWICFQLLQALLNAIVIVSVITLPVLSAVYSATTASDLALVCTFCVLWGFGSLSFGMSIKLLGMAVGTSTVMTAAYCPPPPLQ